MVTGTTKQKSSGVCVCMFFFWCLCVCVCLCEKGGSEEAGEGGGARILSPPSCFFLSLFSRSRSRSVSLARVHALAPSLALSLSLPFSRPLSRARSLSGRRLGRLSTLAPNAKGKYRSSTCSSSGLVVEHVYGEHILWRTHSKSQNTFYRGNSLRMP